MARETDEQGNWTEDKNPHGGSETESISEKADGKWKELGNGRRHRADCHDTGTLPGQTGV